MGYSPGGRGFQGRGGGRRDDDRNKDSKKPGNGNSLFWLIWIPVTLLVLVVLTKFVFHLW